MLLSRGGPGQHGAASVAQHQELDAPCTAALPHDCASAPREHPGRGRAPNEFERAIASVLVALAGVAAARQRCYRRSTRGKNEFCYTASRGLEINARTEHSRRSGHVVRTAGGGRSDSIVRVDVNVTEHLDVPRASVTEMDAFMAEHASSVAISAKFLERIEDYPNDPSIKLCYVGSSDMQFLANLLSVRIAQKASCRPGRCDVTVVKIQWGSVDARTGHVTFPELSEESGLNYRGQSIITWRPDGAGGLRLQNNACGYNEIPLPWWIPVPEGAVQSIANAWGRRLTTRSAREVLAQIASRFPRWQRQRQIERAKLAPDRDAVVKQQANSVQ
eukprot:TRINITY_DN108321_c0_g1_i1.p1 TRINITY_DN108321_c0_g1~~TRINITY_DN108321_c0_g1_i1.p1  ORF type:complete len:332 (+),score=26.34 TRINITY_DN108321_c0_g1_i1:46-1041(+)